MVLLSARNPFCSSASMLFSSTHLVNLLFIKPQHNLYEAGARAIPLYDNGSILFKLEDFGIGLSTHLDHSVGTFPTAKQTLNSLSKKKHALSFLRTSIGISSKPGALLHFAFLIIFCISSNVNIPFITTSYVIGCTISGWGSKLIDSAKLSSGGLKKI